MTIKIDRLDPTSARDAVDSAFSGVVDLGAPAGQRKRLFQFATRPRRKPLGPSRSEFGCD